MAIGPPCLSRGTQGLLCVSTPTLRGQRNLHKRKLRVHSSVDEAGATVKEQWWTKHPQPNLLEASSVQDLCDILEANKDRLVLVDFYAPWCNACKALYPKLSQLCAQNPQVVVVKLNWEENKSMAKTLKVNVRIPIYYEEEK